ncbi:MAG: hypothetical protein MUC88_07015 [Planctomycetes bacterium]|nr:hypothetical protein [Planctomycetota bacterium]
MYGAFAVYLYRPHFGGFTGWQWLLPLNAWWAALGGYAVSRRWVAGFTGSLLAGLLYGFSPFLLSLAKFHPSVSLLAAGVPWLFVPAAATRTLSSTRSRWLSLLLWLLPFGVIALFFYLSAEHQLFAAPPQAPVRLPDLAGALAPLALLPRSTVLFGVYHIPVAAFVLGLAMVWIARRWNLLLVAAAGLALTFSRSFLGAEQIAWLGISPILWLTIPMVWCAVWSGIGLQGLVAAGHADRHWILALAVLLGTLAIVTLLLAARCFQVFLGLGDGYGRLFVAAAQIYLLGVAVLGVIFVLTWRNLRWHGLRWALLSTVLGMDIFLSARYIVDGLL